MKDNRPIWAALGMLVGVTLLATAGYRYVEGWGWFDSLYMAVITLSTVGYEEVHPLSDAGRAVTLTAIVGGLLAVSFLVGGVSRIFLEGELRRVLGRRRMERDLARLDDHYVVCGYGRVGRVVCQELATEGVPFVIIDSDERMAARIEADGHLCVHGDATEEGVLGTAGIERSRGLILALPSEADSVYVTLLARDLAPDLFIIARSISDNGDRRLRAAGADRVVSPNIIGGHRLAQSVLRPSVVEFVDIVTRRDALAQLQLEELHVSPSSELHGRSIKDCDVRGRWGLMVVGILQHDGDVVFNPSPRHTIEAGTTLIVLGRREDLERFESAL